MFPILYIGITRRGLWSLENVNLFLEIEKKGWENLYIKKNGVPPTISNYIIQLNEVPKPNYYENIRTLGCRFVFCCCN